MISVTKAARIVGVTAGRIRQMLRGGLLDGVKISERAWIVDETSAREASKNVPNLGRPRSGKKSA